MKMWILRRPRYTVMVVGPFSVTVWKKGALSLWVWGHCFQIVLGDWWEAKP